MTTSSQSLLDAIQSDDLVVMLSLIAAGADPRALIGVYAVRPLRWAVMHGARRCTEALLDRGCPADEGDSYGTPLGVAISHQNEDLALLLLHRGADPNLRSGSDQEVLLATCRMLPVLQALLAHGADLEQRFHARFAGPGATPLLDAIAEGNDACIDLFLAHGASLRARGEWEFAAPLALIANNVRHQVEVLRCETDARSSARMRKAISTLRARAARLITAGAGTDGSEAELAAWLRGLDLDAVERERLEFQALNSGESLTRPDFLARFVDSLGTVDAVSDLNRLRSIVTSVLANTLVKGSPTYPALFALCCDRQRPIAAHAIAIYGTDAGWSEDSDESGLVESFADGSYDTLGELAECLDDRRLSASPAWRICIQTLADTCQRLNRFPGQMEALCTREWFEDREDWQEVKALLRFKE